MIVGKRFGNSADPLLFFLATKQAARLLLWKKYRTFVADFRDEYSP